ncbi:HlyD family secretion protein [Undibacterium cyanobacteriorum]|uniref:HlyD family secretion protein n=1 Tax=Undibacterium cyanobacteriorum TaxID=3073561 RepID=A0ABY9RK11_9BURK|nr:HlyD family secretion protein [Undibacterium sp. 20NA77.5]WMW81554.1 HlyD family secretion protein [Undibacterium sp. 20NA77.5]
MKADNILVSPKVSGYVTSIDVNDNQEVKKGQALIHIDATDYQIKEEQTLAAVRSQQAVLVTTAYQENLQKSQIHQALANVRSAKVAYEKAVKDHSRDVALLAKGFISHDRSDASASQLEVSAAGLAQAEAQLQATRDQLQVIQSKSLQIKADIEQSEAQVRSARSDLHHAVVYAPSDGVVANKLVNLGQFVKAGTQLMTVVPSTQIYIQANFKETQLARLRKGQVVRIVVDADQTKPFAGVIDSLAPATGSEFSLLPAENATGNFTKIVQRVPVKIMLVDQQAKSQIADLLRPGLSVTVEVSTKEREGANQDLRLGAAPSFTSFLWLR